MSTDPEVGWHDLLRRLPWQGDLALDQFATMPRGGGVYMLHATADGVPASIPRARATDADGVLLIGESEDLASRGRPLAVAMQERRHDRLTKEGHHGPRRSACLPSS